jgi:hypothetical protein
MNDVKNPRGQLMPCDYSKYPPDWKSIRARILERDHNRCEKCGVPNYAWGWRDASGVFSFVNKRLLQESGCTKPPFRLACTFKDGRVGEIKVIMIILTIAHLDHDITHNSDDNLKALCQRDHLHLDKELHAKNAGVTRRKLAAGQGELFA